MDHWLGSNSRVLGRCGDRLCGLVIVHDFLYEGRLQRGTIYQVDQHTSGLDRGRLQILGRLLQCPSILHLGCHLDNHLLWDPYYSQDQQLPRGVQGLGPDHYHILHDPVHQDIQLQAVHP